MSKTLRVLHVEDQERDVVLIARHLTKAGYELKSERVDTVEGMRTALEAGEWDVILCDYAMPHFDALRALGVRKEMKIDIPLLIISGTIGEAVAVEAMLAGANDYLMKDNLIRLVPAIERELVQAVNRREQKQAEEKLRENESLLSSTQRIAHIGSWVMELSDSGTVETAKEFWSDEHYRIFGFEPGEVEASDEVFYNSVHPDDRERLAKIVRESIEQKTPFDIEHRIILPDGRERILQAMAEVVIDSKTGKPLKLLGSVQDITERRRVEDALRESERAERAAAATQPSTHPATKP